MTPPSHWPIWFWLIVDVLAVARLTRLVVLDSITAPFRRWLAATYEGPLVELAFCVWCLSIWFAAGAVLFTFLLPTVWGYAALALAVSMVVGYLLAGARFDLDRALRWTRGWLNRNLVAHLRRGR